MTTELEIVTPVEAQLEEYAGKSSLATTSTAPLIVAFKPIFIEARKALADAKGVAESVKDATCVSEIKRARACRLAIRKVRIEGEKTRKAQKADAKAYGELVDGFYKMLEANLDPVETALQDAEDTAERAETARKDALEVGRKAALAPFVDDVAIFPVREMGDAAFAALLTGVRVAYEQAAAAVAKAKADQLAKEAADAAERERVRAENERLRQEAIAREAAAKAEREAAEKKLADERAESARVAAAAKAKADAEAKVAADLAAKERAEIEAKAKAEREAIEAKQRAEKAEWDAKRKAEQDAAFAAAEIERKRVAAEKAEADEKTRLAELKAKADAAKAKAAADKKLADERAEREKAEQALADAKKAEELREAARVAKERQEAEDARNAALAPERQKLLAYANNLVGLAVPTLTSDGGVIVSEAITARVAKLAQWIQSEANTL